MEKELKSIIKEKRKDHIEKMGVPFDKINQAFQSGVIFSEDAKNLGYNIINVLFNSNQVY